MNRRKGYKFYCDIIAFIIFASIAFFHSSAFSQRQTVDSVCRKEIADNDYVSCVKKLIELEFDTIFSSDNTLQSKETVKNNCCAVVEHKKNNVKIVTVAFSYISKKNEYLSKILYFDTNGYIRVEADPYY